MDSARSSSNRAIGVPADTTGTAPDRLPLTTRRPELLRHGHDDQFRALVHDLLAFGARIREIRDELGGLIGLSGPAYTALIAIAHLQRDGEVTVTSVSQHLNVSQPFTTAEVRKLVEAGLVDKSRSSADRRAVSLTVTDRGLELLADLAPDQQQINDTLFAGIDADAFDRLAATLPVMIADADSALALAADLHTRRTTSGRTA